MTQRVGQYYPVVMSCVFVNISNTEAFVHHLWIVLIQKQRKEILFAEPPKNFLFVFELGSFMVDYLKKNPTQTSLCIVLLFWKQGRTHMGAIYMIKHFQA